MSHTRIDTYPECVVHDKVCTVQITDNTESLTGATHPVKSRMFQQITGKEIAGLYLLVFQMLGQLVTGESRICFYRKQKAEPAGI